MAAKTEARITFGFADETERKLAIGPFNPAAAAVVGMKANVMNFNENVLDSVKDKILSDGGASCTGIVAAAIVTVEQNEINLND